MRLQGKPVVMYAAPTTDLNISWAGYGHIGLAPRGTSCSAAASRSTLRRRSIRNQQH